MNRKEQEEARIGRRKIESVVIVRVLLIMVAHNVWEVFELHVKSAFLHGEIQEKIYVH